jgi:hypothetical protein
MRFIMSENSKTFSFLSLPAELRNQVGFHIDSYLENSNGNKIYEDVFTPVRCEDGLIPSSQNLKTLAFLFTCRQIYEEAHVLAYSLAFSVTNRWHRTDLEAFAALANSYACPIKTLKLATQWRRYHVDDQGKRHFLDSMIEHARFVWDVVELFSTVENITILHAKPSSFATTLFHVLDLDIVHGKIRWKASFANTKGEAPEEVGKILLVTKTSKGLRKVVVDCQDVPSAESTSPWPAWYGSTL